MHRSYYIIKPDGIASCQLIEEIIEAKIKITKRALTPIPEELVRLMYPAVTPGLLKAIITEYDHPNIVGIVEGRNAVQKMYELCGTETDPRHCGRKTIRYLFGAATDRFIDSKPFYRNIIHRPRNDLECREILPHIIGLIDTVLEAD